MRSMAIRHLLAAAFASTLLAAAPTHAGTTTVLDCNFNAEPLDALIATGGPAAGQPVTLGGAPAYVRAAPFATPSLEIGDDSGTTSEQVRFEFVNDWEIDTGIVEISLQVHFPDLLDTFVLYVRENGFSSVSFLNLRFNAGGTVSYGDLDSGGSTTIGAYPAGASFPLTITFDLDAGTYDIDLNGALIRDDESMGAFPQGIGAVLVGADFDPDFDGLMSIDDLLVTTTADPTAIESTSWGDLKAGWR